MPVKECPLIPTLARINLPREDYIRMKMEGVKGFDPDKQDKGCM